MSNSSNSESTENNPENRSHEKPVAWLAGRDLLGGIKGILLYTAYGSKLDPRDWMSGKVVSFDSDGDEKAWLDSGDGKQFWFDFLADAGDGTRAMYSIAYMTMTDLWENADDEPLTTDGKRKVAFETGKGRTQLPRGQFLIFGGDTAYHVADFLTIANRIQRPFTWAYLDLIPHRAIDIRPVFGIPGNHDYYDQLDGFRRQFRKSSRNEPPQPPVKPSDKDAQLSLAGYRRKQEASYFAIKLPFDWWLWALDTETGEIDPRQKKFFLTRGVEGAEQPPPDKLIIVTPSPSTVFGKSADKENDFKATKAMMELFNSQEQPFLPEVKEDGSFDFSQTGDAQLKKGQCRLDLAGDVHHYARYWGKPPDKPTQVRQRAAGKPVPQAKSYASVVTGLGGAFHHPSNTYDDDIQEQVLYPTEKNSRDEVGKALFDFRSIWRGGYVWLFGFIIAFLIYFAMSVTQSSRQDISQIGVLESLSLGKQEEIKPTAARPDKETPCADVPALRPLNLFTLAPSFKTCEPKPDQGCPANGPPACSTEKPFYFFITSPRVWPAELWAGTGLIFLSLAGTIVTFFLNTWLFGPKRDPRKQKDPNTPNPAMKLLRIVPPIAIAVLVGMYTVGRYRAYITPFVSSLLVLFTMIVAAGGIVLTVRYNEYLFIKGHEDYIKKQDRIWPWVLPFLSVLVFAVGLSAFGRNNLPALLVTDILFALVFVAVSAALVYLLPFRVASGELFYGWSKVAAFFGKLLIGIWHAILQLFVAFVLVRRGTWLTWIVVLILVVLPSVLAANFLQKNRRIASITGAIRKILPTGIAAFLFKNNYRVLLAVCWFLFGALVLVLPWLTSKPTEDSPSWLPRSPFLNWLQVTGWFPTLLEWFGAKRIFPSLVAGLVGAVMSCLWFGWYLGVCSLFNGHNNEAGGAARIEKFKQFIRFKVTEDRLTGYVIAVDDVSLIGTQKENGEFYDGRDLKPKLIDVFYLEPKR